MEFSKIKKWNIDIEKEITEKWKNSKLFEFNEGSGKKIYSIDTPPPYINAPIHIGHATTYVYQDFFARYRRMKNFEVIFPLGLDRNGLPIEVSAEKKFKASPFDVGREKFLGYCKKLLEETSLESAESFARLGISFNSYDKTGKIGSVYFTDDERYRQLTQETFIDLFKRGLVYEDTRINNWDPVLQTTISDSEIEYENKETFFVYVKWKVKETGEEVVIATTRPELICTCKMVVFNPDDKRYKKFEGKTAISPLFNKEIPIKAHAIADMDKGTGMAMMCSAGDLSDIQFFREMNLEPVIAINKEGKMNRKAGFLEGLKVKDARKKIIEVLKREGLVVKEEKIVHRTPISERSKAEIEFIEMPEYYLRQLEIKDKIYELAKSETEFYPEFSRKILERWIKSISIDWPISRRRFYATEIPLWTSKNSQGEVMYAVPPKGKYYQPWKESVPENAEVYLNRSNIGKVKDFKNLVWKGEERVFDTWFDSSISALYILNYRSEFFDKAYPVTLRPQGKEIVRTWLYYSLLRCYYQTGKIPFKHVWIHNHILDEKGRKMSKSLGNVIDPRDILKKYGAEAFRLWAAEEGDLSKQDLMCSEERIKAKLKTINKIINVARFVFLFNKPEKKPVLSELDKIFIEYIDYLTDETDKSYMNYDFHNPAKNLRYFLWEIFASHYIEIIKPRVYNSSGNFSKEENASARYTLHYLLERFLFLAYPIIPQLTSVIAKEMGIDLLTSEFPESHNPKDNLEIIEKIIEFNKKVYKTKKEKGISLKNEISGIKIPKELEAFKKDLINAHSLV